MVMVVVDEDKEENKEENKKRKKKKRKKRKKKREKTARSLCSTTTTVSSSVSFLYTRVTVLLLFYCFVLFCFVLFFFRQRQTKKNKKNSSVFLSLSDCVCLEDSFQFNNDTHFFGTKIKVLLLGEMEVMEARTKGSGWEITSTLNAQEKKKKKKKKNDEELKIACAEKEEEEEEEEEEVIFKNALQSFSLISALRYPPTRDGVHQRTGESAKGAVSRSSKKPKRSGNEENELDGAALTEIRSNSSRKKRKQQEERKTKSLERKLSENQQHDDAQPQEEFEEEEEEKKRRRRRRRRR